MSDSRFTPGPYLMRGTAIYARSPQDVDSARYKGFTAPEIDDPIQGALYLIAESIPHAPTRRLLATAPTLYLALKVMMEAEERIARDSFAEGVDQEFNDDIWRRSDPDGFARYDNARNILWFIDEAGSGAPTEPAK